MKRHSLFIKVAVTGSLLLLLLVSVKAVASEEKRVITGEADGLTLNYSQELYWDETQFNRKYDEYSADEAKYLEDFVESFTTKFLSSDLEATDWAISFRSGYELKTGKATYSTLFKCKIHGAASGTAEDPYYRTEWLLIPILGRTIDLYAFKYITDRTLAYEGEIDHISTTITFRFLEPINHCHYHIWYKH